MIAGFSSETMKARREHTIFKVLKEKVSLEFYNPQNILKKVWNKNIFRQTKTERICHQKTSTTKNVKELLQAEGKWYLDENIDVFKGM